MWEGRPAARSVRRSPTLRPKKRTIQFVRIVRMSTRPRPLRSVFHQPRLHRVALNVLHNLNDAVLQPHLSIVISVLPSNATASLPRRKTGMTTKIQHHSFQAQIFTEREERMPMIRHNNKRMEHDLALFPRVEQTDANVCPLLRRKRFARLEILRDQIKTGCDGESALAKTGGMGRLRLFHLIRILHPAH